MNWYIDFVEFFSFFRYLCELCWKIRFTMNGSVSPRIQTSNHPEAKQPEKANTGPTQVEEQSQSYAAHAIMTGKGTMIEMRSKESSCFYREQFCPHFFWRDIGGIWFWSSQYACSKNTVDHRSNPFNRIVFLRFLQFCFKSNVNFLNFFIGFPYFVSFGVFVKSPGGHRVGGIEVVGALRLARTLLLGRQHQGAMSWRCRSSLCRFSLKFHWKLWCNGLKRETFWPLETCRGLSSHFAAVSQDAGSRRVRRGIDSEWHAACPIHFDSSTSTSSTFAGIHFAVSKLSQWIKSSISQCICFFKQSKRDFCYAQKYHFENEILRFDQDEKFLLPRTDRPMWIVPFRLSVKFGWRSLQRFMRFNVSHVSWDFLRFEIWNSTTQPKV